MPRISPDNHILLVEDDELNQMVVQDLFAFGDVVGELVCVHSAEEALIHINRQMPSLVLMDIELPDMTGLEAARQLRLAPETRELPIWALTAHAMKGYEQQVFAAGCTRLVTKPVNGRTLADQLTQFLTQRSHGKDVSCPDC
jgi:CheY-like chemotaxis protein